MGNSNPYQAAQAALVLNHLVLDIEKIDAEALTRFCNDPCSDERMKVTELFEVKSKKKSDLLMPLSVRRLPAIKEFIARDHFVVDTSETAELKIYALGYNFQNWFLGKIENDVEECEVKISKILKPTRDKSIIRELGDKAKNALAHVYEFLKSVNSRCYIFYIKDVSGVLRVVIASWVGDGWDVCARSVEDVDGWGADDRVVSR